MQKKNYKGRCERRTLIKAEEVCRFYSKIQSAYANELEQRDDVENVRCNVLMDGLELGEYTTDFLCKKTDGTYFVRECVQSKYLTKPKTVRELDASWDYWKKHGVKDWGIVIEKEEEADGKEPTDPNE